MARVGFVMPAIDEAGNRISTGQQARVFDDMACTTATVVTDDAAGGTTITQPITPTTGAFTPLTVTTGTGDTTLTVSSTTGFSVGQYVPIYDGTTTKWRFIRSILSGPPRLTIESPIGVVFSSTNTIVGHPAYVGVVAGFVPDTTFHYLQITETGSGLAGPPSFIPTSIGISAVGVAEEGTTVGTRALVNFISPFITATDNAGATRVDVTGPTSGTPVSIGAANAAGSATTLARSDHVHEGGIVITAEQATTSGTSVDFTGIPATVKRITVMLNSVSTNGTSQVIVQLGDAGGVEATGYVGGSAGALAGGATSVGFATGYANSGASRHGEITLTLQHPASNRWTCSFVLYESFAYSAPQYGGGIKALSATLDRVRLTTIIGTETFDAGSVSIAYE